MTDLPPPDLTEAARHMLGECIREACGEDVNLPGWVADEIAAEFDRRGTADVDHWRARALEAESRVDGQAWADLEAERERLVEYADAAMGIICNAHRKRVDDVTNEDGASPGWAEAARRWIDAFSSMTAACSSPGAPPPESCPDCEWNRERGPYTLCAQHEIDGAASPEAPTLAGACPRCCEGMDTEDDEREHLRHVVTAVIENWLRIHLELCRAGIGDMNSEEIAQRKILDQVQYLALSGVDYSLAPHVVDAVLVALAARPPASSPPVEEHTEPDDDRPRCDARISPSWAEQWVRCGSLISGGRCDAFGHGPAAQPSQSSPGVPPTAGGVS